MAESDQTNHIPEEDLSAYLDGAYQSAQEREVIEQHLAVCKQCREELESLRAVSTMLSDLPEPEVPRSFRLMPEAAATVRDEGSESSSGPEPVRPWILRYQSAFRYAGLAAALLLVVLVTIDLLPDDTDDADDAFTLMEEPAMDVADDDQPATMDDQELADAPEAESDLDVAEEEAVEEAAPEEDRDAVADDPLDDPVSDADEPTDEVITDEADEPDDHPVAEPEAQVDDGEHPLAESAPDQDVDDDEVDTRIATDADDGISSLQIAAIALAILAVALLSLGFILPRWWSASS
jgi:hypothetical protein